LDRFLKDALRPGQAITPQVAQRWIAGMEHLSLGTRANRINVLRQFCLYLRHFDPRTCIIHQAFLPRRTRPAPHIYTRDEVRRIIAAARRIGPAGSFRPAVIATLIGLLYATGIRVGEALGLVLGDVDLRRRVIEIREGKFKKSRLIPLSESSARHLATYLRRRRQAAFPTSPPSFVFVAPSGRSFGHPHLTEIFLSILRGLGLRGPKGERGPRIHDFRHTFAVNRLLAWYRQGVNLGAKLPLLSTYLGHSTVTGTQFYLHATAELLESADRRFHAFFAIPPAPRKHRHGTG
jgi:integrase